MLDIVPLLLLALGKGFEHLRPDRDDYVTIQWQNIMRGNDNQLKNGVYTRSNLYDLCSLLDKCTHNP